MLSFITLSIAYYIELSYNSFLCALIIGTVLGCLLRGRFLSAIYEVMGIIVLSSMFYKWVKPDSFLSFVGYGTLFSVLNLIQVFLINFIFNRFDSLNLKVPNEGNLESIDRIIEKEAMNIIYCFLEENGLNDFLKNTGINYEDIRKAKKFEEVSEFIHHLFMARLDKDNSFVHMKCNYKSLDLYNKVKIYSNLISHYLVYEDYIEYPISKVHYHFSPASLEKQRVKRERLELKLKEITLLTLEDKKLFLSMIDTATYDEKNFFTKKIIRYSECYDYDEEYNRILFALFLTLSRSGMDMYDIESLFNKGGLSGFWSYDVERSSIWLVKFIHKIMFSHYEI